MKTPTLFTFISDGIVYVVADNNGLVKGFAEEPKNRERLRMRAIKEYGYEYCEASGLLSWDVDALFHNVAFNIPEEYDNTNRLSIVQTFAPKELEPEDGSNCDWDVIYDNALKEGYKILYEHLNLKS